MTLSPRQKQIMRRIAQGDCDKEIAQLLGISICTVRFHIRIIFAKLGAKNRPHAVAIWK